MIVLNIKQAGLFIELPGMAPVRTPAKINITKLDTSIVIRKLASLGVQEYNITMEKEPEKQKAKPIKQKKEEDLPVGLRLGRIEALLEKIANTPATVITSEIEPKGKSTKKKIKKKVKDEPVFIPNIQTDGLSLEGDMSQSVEESRDDTNEAADLLKNMNNKKQ